MTMRPRAAIVGIAGTALTAEEAALFRATAAARRHPVRPQRRGPRPAPRPDRRELRDLLRGRGADPGGPGGRPGRPAAAAALAANTPPAAAFDRLAEPGRRWPMRRCSAMICAEPAIDVVCAPVLDLRLPGAHDIIGDRAFGEPTRPGGAARPRRGRGLLAAGCIPVVKHIPGHGRALVDSHHELPRVRAARRPGATTSRPFAALPTCPG